MNLNVFEGFPLEMAASFSCLAEHDIKWLREEKLILPKLTGKHYLYGFADLLVMRLVRELKRMGVQPKNIKKASQYLEHVDPSKSLTNLVLWVRADKGEVLYLGEDPDPKYLVSLTSFGQLVAKNLLIIIPVGKQLETVRKNVVDYDRKIDKSLRAKKLIPFSQIKRKYGYA